MRYVSKSLQLDPSFELLVDIQQHYMRTGMFNDHSLVRRYEENLLIVKEDTKHDLEATG